MTKSVAPHSTVTIKTHEMQYNQAEHHTEEKELEQDETWFYVI